MYMYMYIFMHISSIIIICTQQISTCVIDDTLFSAHNTAESQASAHSQVHVHVYKHPCGLKSQVMIQRSWVLTQDTNSTNMCVAMLRTHTHAYKVTTINLKGPIIIIYVQI